MTSEDCKIVGFRLAIPVCGSSQLKYDPNDNNSIHPFSHRVFFPMGPSAKRCRPHKFAWRLERYQQRSQMTGSRDPRASPFSTSQHGSTSEVLGYIRPTHLDPHVQILFLLRLRSPVHSLANVGAVIDRQHGRYRDGICDQYGHENCNFFFRFVHSQSVSSGRYVDFLPIQRHWLTNSQVFLRDQIRLFMIRRIQSSCSSFRYIATGFLDSLTMKERASL